jgi:cytochrome c oxidase subunit 2
MLPWHLPQASSYATDVDQLIWLIAVIVGVFFLAAEVIFFYLIFRYRARAGVRGQYVAGEDKSEKRWVSWPHYAVLVFDVVILLAALRVWNTIKIDAPAPEETVRVIAQQWAWTFVHPGPDGRLDTADDIRTVDDLHVQQGRLYRYELHSKDVLHSFSVPVFRLKQDAVPGRMIAGWFRPTVAGDFDIQCAEICGIGHGLMPARIHVRPAAAHAEWMATAVAQAPVASAAAPAPADATGSSGAAGMDHTAHTGDAQ